MKIENRQQILAAAAIAVVGLLLLDRVVVTPMIKSWKERSARIADLQKSITQGESLIGRADVVRDRWGYMQANSLSAQTAERKLLEAFQRWSRESRITLSSIQPQWKQNEDDYSALECRANASGTAAELAQFIYNIEKDPMALRIESMEITSKDDTGRNLALALQVSGLVLNLPAQ